MTTDHGTSQVLYVGIVERYRRAPEYDVTLACYLQCVPAIGRHTEVLQRLVHAVVPDPDLNDLARFLRSRNRSHRCRQFHEMIT